MSHNETTMIVRPIYLVAAGLVFLVEVAIARGVIPGAFVRNSLGDVLVVPLLHFFLRGVTRLPTSRALAIVLAVAFTVEALQYLQLAGRLGFEHGSLPSIVLGTTFSVADLLMYCVGGLLAAWADVHLLRRDHRRRSAPET